MSRRAVYSWVLGATIVAIVVRLPGLDREITHDEAYSWLGYASMPYATLLSTYDMPNNHLLHSAAMRLSSRMFGGDQEWVLRAPAFVAGVVTIPMMAGLATAALGSPVAGIVAAWWMALHPSHISYSNTARGYALLVLFGALSWWSVVLAFQGRPRFWIVFAVAAFLATWTIPSGVFLLLALGGWALVTAWRRGGATGARPVLLATTAAVLACVLAYVAVFEELQSASERWGIKLWSEPGEALAALWSGAELLTGGSALMAGLVLLGWSRWLQRRDAVGVQVVAVVVVPLVAALLSGVAGQPRSYFYLLPAVLVSASAWAIDPRQQVRRVGAILFVVGLVVLGWAQAKRPPEDHGYVPLAEAFARLPTRDILAAPLFLEVPLDVYSREAETEKLRDILKQGRLDGVMFVCSETDPRANFDNYVMFDDDTLYEVTLPETSFQEFHQHGTLRLLGLTGGQHLYPRGEQEWEVVHGHAGMRLSGAAFGALPSLGVMSSADDFIALEATEFSVPQWAIVTAVFARRGASAVATLCANVEGEWQPQVAYRGQVLHLMAADSTDLIWSLETRMVLAQPDQRYAACITGEGAGERYVADLIYTYFPLE